MGGMEFERGTSVLGVQPVLTVCGLQKTLGATVIASDVTFDLLPGAHALTGANGTGKTTLLAMCAGAEPMDAGKITIAGEDIVHSPVLARKHLGWLPDEPCIYPFLTGQAFLNLVAAAKDATNSDALSEYLQRFRLSQLLGLRFDAMSLGMQRKFMLVAALLGNPQLLILDEPTNGFDSEALACLVEIITARSATSCVLLSTHDERFIQRTNATCWALADGKVRRRHHG